jgi:hypothetical protein
MRRLFALLIAVLPIVGLAQTTNRPEGQVEAATASRIATLENRIEELDHPTESEKELLEACRHHNCQSAAPGVPRSRGWIGATP